MKANFEKAYWQLEPTLCDDKKELAKATLRSIALNYIDRKGPRPPKALVRSINQLKKRDDIVISKPDKGSGVVVMNKSDYIRLLSEASIKVQYSKLLQPFLSRHAMLLLLCWGRVLRDETKHGCEGD